MPESQPLVIKTQQMKNGCMEIVDVHFVFGDASAVVVGFSVGDAGLNAAAAQPSQAFRTHDRERKVCES